jgi:hypothetical protein
MKKLVEKLIGNYNLKSKFENYDDVDVMVKLTSDLTQEDFNNITVLKMVIQKYEPGVYSIFIRYENAFYIPYFSGANGTAFFEVKQNAPTQLEIILRGNSNIE